jgi:hypothetical protein
MEAAAQVGVLPAFQRWGRAEINIIEPLVQHMLSEA